MAHPNEREYLKRYLSVAPMLPDGRVLEVGSKQYGHGIAYRPLFPGREWLGVDLEGGPGVDLVWDLSMKEEGPIALSGPFAAILCCSVLEHCRRPWLMAELLEDRLAPGGLLYVTVPWIWRHHPYPKDLWRLSLDGIRALFTGVEWHRMAYATQQFGEFFDEDQDFNQAPWRQIQGQRVALVTQLACAVGRKAA